MSHNINEDRMFYVGEKPWHGIGTELNKPATAREAIIAAKLDYRVELQPIFIHSNGPQQIIGKRATVRCDSNVPLGVVGDQYQVIQNIEAFDFFDSIVGEGKAIYHTAGALGLGERIWIMAKLPQDMVVKNDVVEKYLLLTNSHDGRSALRMYFTPIRVVCQNTLIMSMKDAKDGIVIRHTGNIKTKIEEAQRILGIATVFYSEFEKSMGFLADTKLTTEEANGYFETLLFEGKKEEDVSSRIKNQKNDLLALFENGKGNDAPEIKHSLFAAYNAVTEYADHFRTVRHEQENKANRLESIWFGSGARFKVKAYNLAMQFANE